MFNFEKTLRLAVLILMAAMLSACLGNTADEEEEDIDPNPGELSLIHI